MSVLYSAPITCQTRNRSKMANKDVAFWKNVVANHHTIGRICANRTFVLPFDICALHDPTIPSRVSGRPDQPRSLRHDRRQLPVSALRGSRDVALSDPNPARVVGLPSKPTFVRGDAGLCTDVRHCVGARNSEPQPVSDLDGLDRTSGGWQHRIGGADHMLLPGQRRRASDRDDRVYTSGPARDRRTAGLNRGQSTATGVRYAED